MQKQVKVCYWKKKSLLKECLVTKSYVYQSGKEMLNCKYPVPTFKHDGGSIMCWAGFAARAQIADSIMEKKKGYHGIFQHNLKPSVRKLKLGYNFELQHDNDPEHHTIAGCGMDKICLNDWSNIQSSTTSSWMSTKSMQSSFTKKKST